MSCRATDCCMNHVPDLLSLLGLSGLSWQTTHMGSERWSAKLHLNCGASMQLTSKQGCDGSMPHLSLAGRDLSAVIILHWTLTDLWILEISTAPNAWHCN